MKKRILVLVPVMPDQSDIESIAKTLTFLQGDFQLDFLDPLSILEPVSKEAYYQLWQNELAKRLNDYEGFFGFSFGGVILQQCFSLFAATPKNILLFSTPTFADEGLQKKLGEVIRLCQENKVGEALRYLYPQVFYPNLPPPEAFLVADEKEAARRLIFGLQRVLETDSRKILNDTRVDHLHLIGEYSRLVNLDNVTQPKTGRLVVVPKAGMRILQDNESFCHNLIVQRLDGEG